MNTLIESVRDWGRTGIRGWNEFWFRPSDPATLGLIRILGGAMLFYTHFVWALDLEAFFGQHPWLTHEAVTYRESGSYAWSYLWLINSSTVLWIAHLAALLVFACLTLGLFTRVTSILAFVIAVAYANRLTGALFGLDQINIMLALYIMVGPSGAAYSLDRLLARRKEANANLPVLPKVGATVAIRLSQLHMCIIYLFAGMAKNGMFWEEGTAIWFSVANLEYQSMDLTWLSNHPYLVNFLTLTTVWWERSYIALVWPRFTRPIVITMAIGLHLGIAFGMGMITFGLAMIFGNMAFVSPRLVRAVLDPTFGRLETLTGISKPSESMATDAQSEPDREQTSGKRRRKSRKPANKVAEPNAA